MTNKKKLDQSPDVIHVQPIECYGIANLLMYDDSLGEIGVNVFLNVLKKREGFEDLATTHAQIQHFRDGTTRVLCPHSNRLNDCFKFCQFSQEEILAALKKVWKNYDFDAVGDAKCPYGTMSYEEDED